MDSQVHIDLSHLMQLLEKQLNEDGPGMLLTCQDIFAAYIKVTNYDIRKERIKWLISMLATDEMKNNDQFYELVNRQPFKLQNHESHPYNIDWSKYDQLQKFL